MTLAQLSRQRWRISICLSAVVVVIYFGFILLVAFDKPLTALRPLPGLSLGILLGALVIVAAWLTTWIYVRWASRHYDPRVQTLRDAGAQHGANE